jgi:hypothetical protein
MQQTHILSFYYILLIHPTITCLQTIQTQNLKIKHIKHPQNGHPKIHEIIWETSGIAVTMLACGSYAHPSLVARESMHHHWCRKK